MTSIFIAYRFSGEDMSKLRPVLTSVYNSLVYTGHDPFCSFWSEEDFNEQEMSQEEKYEHCLKEIDSRDVFMPLVKSKEKSHGMEIESKRAIKLDKKYVLAIKKGLDFPDYKEAAHDIIEYKDYQELYRMLRRFNW